MNAFSYRVGVQRDKNMNEIVSILWAVGILVLGYALAFIVSIGIGPGIIFVTAVVGGHQSRKIRMSLGFMGMLSLSLTYAASVLFVGHHIPHRLVFWIVWPALWVAAIMPPFLAQIGRASFERGEQAGYSDYYYLTFAVTVITAGCFVWFGVNKSSIFWVLLLVSGFALTILLYCVIKERVRYKQLINQSYETKPSFNPDEANHASAPYYQEQSEQIFSPLKSEEFATLPVTITVISTENGLPVDITSDLTITGLFHWEALLRESEAWSRIMDDDVRCALPTFGDMDLFLRWKLAVADDIPDLSLTEKNFSDLWKSCKDYAEASL